MLRAITSVILLLLLSACATQKIDEQESSEAKLASDALKQLEAFLPGHYSNFAQHWQDNNLALRLLDISLLLIEPDQAWFLSQQQDADLGGNNQRQQILLFKIIEKDRLELSFAPFRGDAGAAIRAIRSANIAFIPGCEMTIHVTATAYAGETSAQNCRLPAVDGESPGLVKDISIQANNITIGDQLSQNGKALGPPSIQQFQRSYAFSGWAGVKPAQAEWTALAPFNLYSDGQTVALPDNSGNPSGVSIRLSQVPWKRGENMILRLDLINEITGKPTAYAFTGVNTSNIGLNLGHVQIGLERMVSK